MTVDVNYLKHRLITFGIAALVILSAISCTRLGEPDMGTWPETAQWSTLESGQERWSRHETNLGDAWVIVDHETGVAYLETEGGLCRMTDGGGMPTLDAEAEREETR